MTAHCDSRIVHAPGECEFCDMHPSMQAGRIAANVAFTGHEPTPGQIACPADEDRPPGSPSDHRRWGGNKPTSAKGDPSWPAETFASAVMYGDQGGRQPWPLPERIRRRLKRPFVAWKMRRDGYRLQDGVWVYKQQIINRRSKT
jgi:hypothetical protein